MTTPNLRCIFCNSKYHNYRNCTIAYKQQAQKSVNAKAKQEYAGETPNVFVGRYGYPSVNVGLLNVEEYEDHDDPKRWRKEEYTIPRIIDRRTSLINARHGMSIKSPSTHKPTGFSERYLEITREVGLAKKPVDVELGLKHKPTFKTSYDNYAAPHGPRVAITKALLATNPKTDQRIEKASADEDLRATGAVDELHKKGVDEHALTKALSTGTLGLGTRRKLVPTRWSITAVDDMIGKRLAQQVKEHQEGSCTLYLGGYLGNHYAIMCFDDAWQYELFEQFIPQDGREAMPAEHDYEPYHGRKTYAEETAGGYYATRLAILEALAKRKRQASVLAIRVITEEYTAPLGVWVVREAVRKALENKPLVFSERNSMIRYAKEYLARHFGAQSTRVFERSITLKNLREQKKLKDWS